MSVFMAFIVVVGIVIVVVSTIVALGYFAPDRRTDRNAARELERHKVFVDRLREIAYDHRDLDSTLSSIITDEIRVFHQQKRELK